MKLTKNYKNFVTCSVFINTYIMNLFLLIHLPSHIIIIIYLYCGVISEVLILFHRSIYLFFIEVPNYFNGCNFEKYFDIMKYDTFRFVFIKIALDYFGIFVVPYEF